MVPPPLIALIAYNWIPFSGVDNATGGETGCVSVSTRYSRAAVTWEPPSQADCGGMWLENVWGSSAQMLSLDKHSSPRLCSVATPTMESWSRSSRRDKLVLWSQEYFRLMESWRFLKNDSRSRASLKNCGERRGSSCVTHHNTRMLTEKEPPPCAELGRTDDYSWCCITKSTGVETEGLKCHIQKH